MNSSEALIRNYSDRARQEIRDGIDVAIRRGEIRAAKKLETLLRTLEVMAGPDRA